MRHRALLVGLGAIGWRWSQPDDGRSNNAARETHYHTMKHHHLVDIVGGVDTDEGARRDFQGATGTLVYPDLTSALRDTQPSIVTVATPRHTHADLVIEAAACTTVAGIVCEKPMAETVADCRRMLDACSGKTLIIGHQRRYEQRHRLLRAFLKSEAIGKPIAGACYFSGDHLNNGTHAADTMRFLLGDGPWSIYTKAGEVFSSWVSTEHGSVILHSRGNLHPGYLCAMYDDLIECIESGKTPECSGDDGLEAVRMALAAMERDEAAA